MPSFPHGAPERGEALKEARYFVELQTHAKAAGRIYTESCILLPRIDAAIKGNTELMLESFDKTHPTSPRKINILAREACRIRGLAS